MLKIMKMYKAHCIVLKNEESYNYLDQLDHFSWNNLQLFAHTLDYVKTHLKLNSVIEKISTQLFIWLNTVDAEGISKKFEVVKVT